MRKKLTFDAGFCAWKRKNIEVKLYEKSKTEVSDGGRYRGRAIKYL